EEASRQSKRLVTDQAKPDMLRCWLIEIERGDRFLHICAKLFPGVTLREDILGEAFRTVPAVRFLGYFEDELTHFHHLIILQRFSTIRLFPKGRCASVTQNFVNSVKWKSRTFIAGTTMSNASSPDARTAGPSASTLDSISSMLSLNRKLRSPQTTRPPSTRNVPSRVIPVSTFSYGSTSRTYHTRVSSTARSVDATMASSDESPPSSTRFIGASPHSLGSGSPWPVDFSFIFLAVARE